MERPRYGVVLTAGSKEKTLGGYRLEPDPEGKMRLIAGLHDLVNGKLDKLYIAGGARNFGTPLANIYTQYAKRFVERYQLSPDMVIEVKGGVNTETDMEKTKRLLKKENFRGDLSIYSSGYHFERESINNFIRKFSMGTVFTLASETRIQERHNLYRYQPNNNDGKKMPPLPWRILNPDHLSKMRGRNRNMDRLPQFALNLGAYLLRR